MSIRVTPHSATFTGISQIILPVEFPNHALGDFTDTVGAWNLLSKWVGIIKVGGTAGEEIEFYKIQNSRGRFWPHRSIQQSNLVYSYHAIVLKKRGTDISYFTCENNWVFLHVKIRIYCHPPPLHPPDPACMTKLGFLYCNNKWIHRTLHVGVFGKFIFQVDDKYTQILGASMSRNNVKRCSYTYIVTTGKSARNESRT